MYTVVRYNESYAGQWNAFVAESKNGTFLFNRNFMDYHADRFDDFSVLVFEGNKLKALLPAHVKDNVVYSHQGLTYGGLIFGFKLHLADSIAVVKSLLEYYNIQGIERLYIKTIPTPYHKIPAQELDYSLFLANAKLVRRDSISVLENNGGLRFNKTRLKDIKKGEHSGLVIKEDDNFEGFWNTILIPNLQTRYDATPVHSLDEIVLLKQRFPDNIRHFNVYLEDKLVAGTTVFITDTVAKPQYISADDERNTLGSLDFLYNHLITDVFKDKKYFDFGPSNEEQGRKLKGSIAFWKESYGARTLVHDFYEVQTANYVLLDNVII